MCCEWRPAIAADSAYTVPHNKLSEGYALHAHFLLCKAHVVDIAVCHHAWRLRYCRHALFRAGKGLDRERGLSLGGPAAQGYSVREL
jgi:hypothetical protein